MKIVTIVGARPQFIKASALSREIKNHSDIHEILVHTGQHFDENMSDIFFKEMDIPKPIYNLDIHSLTHGAMTGRMLEAIENVLMIERPDFVLVYGDTNSTLAGALAAKKMHIPVAHVEAGLRSFNMLMPEEINRILTDRISDILFCPTAEAIDNLQHEGYDFFPATIVNSGDVMYDAALYYKQKAATESHILEDINIKPGKYILATIHRQENTDNYERLTGIIAAFNEINSELRVIVPMHPRTKKLLHQKEMHTDFTIIDPVGYLDMIKLTSNAACIMTDSGGLQKEAYFFGKYCLTLRDQTEWVELVEGGFNTLTGADKASILKAYHDINVDEIKFDKPLYGDGKASLKIIKALKSFSK
ncbi:MAG: UDP-N-acetylglucosamine 2-epimerase (non-hydrolyzing) [Saprospiraceae bacterium]|nr:UDP-N-acetylglucosamine 2-epimerase (non-hydrolyzing) [Saprospiraceae bacterium]